MTRSYKLVLVGDIVPGMVLSDNLLDRHGKILLPKGTLLTEKLIESLRRHEIEMVPVCDEELSGDERQAKISKRQDRLIALFRKHNYDAPTENANDVLLQCMMDFRRGEDT